MYRVTIFATLFLLFFASAFAYEIGLPNITVYGTSEIKITPDKMIWFLNINNKGAKLNEVANEHTEKVQTVLSLLNDTNIKKENIQTARMVFGENWVYKNKSQVKEGYFASTDVSFTILEFEKYNRIWEELSKIPEVSVQNVFYDHTKRIEYQNETRIKAVLEAKNKAEALVKAVGSEIGEPLLIEEDLSLNEGWQRNVTLNSASFNTVDGDSAAETLSLGTIPIRMRVKVTFRLITHNK